MPGLILPTDGTEEAVYEHLPADAISSQVPRGGRETRRGVAEGNRVSTHSKGGLTDMDFVLAEKIDTLVDD